MIRLAAAIVRCWVTVYTAGLETTTRERIRQEVESDLWEQMNTGDAARNPAREAIIIVLRWTLGIPADVQRMLDEPDSRGVTMWAMAFLSAAAQRRSWLNLLLVSGVSFSLLFIGIGTFIAGVFLIVIPAVLLASPLIILWSGASLGATPLASVWQALLLFLVGMAVLIVLLHLSRLVSLSLWLGGRNRGEQSKHAGLVYHILGVLYDLRAWSSLLLILLVMLSLGFLGLGTFIAAMVLVVTVGSFIANPLIYPQHAVKIGPLVVDTPIESALLVVAGLWLALLTLHVSNLVVGTIGKGMVSIFRRPAVQ